MLSESAAARACDPSRRVVGKLEVALHAGFVSPRMWLPRCFARQASRAAFCRAGTRSSSDAGLPRVGQPEKATGGSNPALGDGGIDFRRIFRVLLLALRHVAADDLFRQQRGQRIEAAYSGIDQ